MPEEEKIGAERVLGFVVKVTPSVEIAQERLSKYNILPHIVVSRRKSWRKGAKEILWTVFSFSGPPVTPSEIIAQLVTMPVMRQTAIERGSLILRRPKSEIKTSGETRAGLTNILDFVKSKARRRRLRKHFNARMLSTKLATHEISSFPTRSWMSLKVTTPIPTVVT